MKKIRSIIIFCLILAISLFSVACGNAQIKSSAAWDKVMGDTVEALTKADANLKIISSGKNSGGGYDEEMSSIVYIDGNKCKSDIERKSGNTTNIATEYHELNEGRLYKYSLIIMQTGYKKDDVTNDFADRLNKHTTMGAFQTVGGFGLKELIGLFDYFTYASDKYIVKTDKLTGIYEKWFLKFAGSLDMNAPLGNFSDFSIGIKNGFVSKLEFVFSSEQTGATTNSSYAFTYEGQSVILPV